MSIAALVIEANGYPQLAGFALYYRGDGGNGGAPTRTVIAIFALLAPSFAVYSALRHPWSASASSIGRAFAASVAPAIALGVSSCVYFALLVVMSNHR